MASSAMRSRISGDSPVVLPTFLPSFFSLQHISCRGEKKLRRVRPGGRALARSAARLAVGTLQAVPPGLEVGGHLRGGRK